MKTMKKKLTIAVSVALLAFPLSSALALARVPNTPPVVVANSTTTAPATTITELQTTDATEVAEAAVATYEAGPKKTLAEVAIAEDLKAAAVTAVAEVDNAEVKAAFELRVSNRAEAIATAKTALQGEAAEVAVAAYEIGPLTTLAEVATAEDLKAAAVTAVAEVDNTEAKAAFELRITNRAEAITTVKAALNALVVDADGNEITPATAFSDFIDSLQLALAFDPARKCELNERHALRKLAQAHKLMKDGNIEASQICLNQYTDKITMAQTFLIEVEKTDSETAKTLDKALVNLDSNNIQVISNLIDKLPPQAAQKLALNVVRSMEKAVTKIQKEEAKAALVTTSETTPVTDGQILAKQAQVALESFKKSLDQKGKIYIEDRKLDQDQHDNEDKEVVEQSKTEQESSKMERNSSQITQEAIESKNENNSEYKIENKTSQVQSITQSRQTQADVLSVETQKSPTVVCPTENDRADRNKQEAHGDGKREGSQDDRSDHK